MSLVSAGAHLCSPCIFVVLLLGGGEAPVQFLERFRCEECSHYVMIPITLK